MAVAESIRKTIETGRIVKPKTRKELHRVTISIGVTEMTSNEPIKEAISRADEAMYKAKENGRNRVKFIPLPQTTIKAVI